MLCHSKRFIQPRQEIGQSFSYSSYAVACLLGSLQPQITALDNLLYTIGPLSLAYLVPASFFCAMSAAKIKACLCTFFITINFSILEAQTISPSIAGEYYLKGVRETACGFKLAPDSSFQFFFSYGALDRYGEGTWLVKNEMIIFNSRPKPLHDFRLIKSEASPDKVRVQLHEPNTVLLRYVHCKIKGDGKIQEGVMNEEGLIEFAPQAVDTIELLFEFCPKKHRCLLFPPTIIMPLSLPLSPG